MDRLTNFDMADREVLHIINDCADDSGYAPIEEIEEQLRLSHPKPASCISSRFAWMARWGWIARHKDEASYRITRIGRDLMVGNIDKALAETIRRLAPGERVLMMRQLGQSYQRSGMAAKIMMRRQWQHNTRRK